MQREVKGWAIDGGRLRSQSHAGERGNIPDKDVPDAMEQTESAL